MTNLQRALQVATFLPTGRTDDQVEAATIIRALVSELEQRREIRTALEQLDLEHSADYRKGYEDGRLKGFEVGHRYGTEQEHERHRVAYQSDMAKVMKVANEEFTAYLSGNCEGEPPRMSIAFANELFRVLLSTEKKA